jgi:hypothetical protein
MQHNSKGEDEKATYKARDYVLIDLPLLPDGARGHAAPMPWHGEDDVTSQQKH